MPMYAELHDGRQLEFPDGTDPSVIQGTVRKMLAEPAAAPDAFLTRGRKGIGRRRRGLCGQRRARASAASAVIAAQSPRAIASLGATQEPPTHRMFDRLR